MDERQAIDLVHGKDSTERSDRSSCRSETASTLGSLHGRADLTPGDVFVSPHKCLARFDPELREASMRSQLTRLRAIAKDTDAAASASYA